MITDKVVDKTEFSVARCGHLAPKVVIVDGHPGCGKTMLSPIVAALERVELLTYAYQTEHICSLYYLGKISEDAACAMVRMWTDLQIYNIMMSREVNLRPSDLSSIFRNVRPIRYLKRLFEKGDEVIPDKIKKDKPILQLTTHSLLGISEPVFSGLAQRVVLLEVVRHPLYMLKQQALNMERLLGNVRHFTVYFKYRQQLVPYWAFGWEDLFLQSNAVEKAIYATDRLTTLTESKKEYLRKKYDAQIITIPFEQFVISPWGFLKQIEVALDTKATALTCKMMRKQRVPRKKYAEGIGLKIYKRCGWEPPIIGADENVEFARRREFALKSASLSAMKILDMCCKEYERCYLGGEKNY